MVCFLVRIYSRVSINVECGDRRVTDQPYTRNSNSSDVREGLIIEWREHVGLYNWANRSETKPRSDNYEWAGVISCWITYFVFQMILICLKVENKL